MIPSLPFPSLFNSLRRLTLSVASVAVFALPVATQAASPYSQIIVFGDSLSDDGNFTHLTRSQFNLAFPGTSFDYADGRFTSSDATSPGSATYSGVWHEQLAQRFLNMSRASNSLDGGTDYAYGDAETTDGTRSAEIQPGFSVMVNNMGQQVTDYLTSFPTADANALYIVWGGANDLFEDSSAANVTATAQRIGNLVSRLGAAGARNFIVPNVPPLGATPAHNTMSDAAALNAASASYRDQLNSVLDSTIANLGAQGVTIKVARLDIFALFQGLGTNASLYGFTNITDPARGANVNVDSYLFWDTIHPTTAGHNQVAIQASSLLAGGRPAFFNGEAQLSGDFDYLAFSSGVKFGYYSYQFFPYLYSTDLGYEYVIDANDADSGVFFYDFGFKNFLYTSPKLYPYLFNFGSNSFYYYFTGTTAPRSFYDFGSGQFVYSSN